MNILQILGIAVGVILLAVILDALVAIFWTDPK